VNDFDKTKWTAPEARFSVGLKAVIPPAKMRATGLSKGDATLHWDSNCRGRILRLSVDPETVNDFEIVTIQVARIAWTANEPVPAFAFARATCLQCAIHGAEHLFGIKWPVLEAGMAFRMVVANRQQEAREFRASLEVEDLGQLFASAPL
jgi:hypothetical protein